MTPELELWQSVVFQVFMDATWDETKSDDQESQKAKRRADAWIRGCGRDFRHVCALASLDPDFLSDAYIQGRVNPAKLRAPITSVTTAQMGPSASCPPPLISNRPRNTLDARSMTITFPAGSDTGTVTREKL